MGPIAWPRPANMQRRPHEYESLAIGTSGQRNVALSRLEDWLKSPPACATPQAKHDVWEVAVALKQMGRWSESSTRCMA